jgi:hypothetical protein
MLVECMIATRTLAESRPGEDGAESDESDKRFHGEFSYFEMVSLDCISGFVRTEGVRVQLTQRRWEGLRSRTIKLQFRKLTSILLGRRKADRDPCRRVASSPGAGAAAGR